MQVQQSTITVEADSLEEARRELQNHVKPGVYLIWHNIDSPGKQNSITVSGKSRDDVLVKAREQIPENAEIIQEKEQLQFEEKSVTIKAFDISQVTDSANEQATELFGENGFVENIELITSGSKGFLGIGRKPNHYAVKLGRYAVFEVTYKTKAKISAKLRQVYSQISTDHYKFTSIEDYCKEVILLLTESLPVAHSEIIEKHMEAVKASYGELPVLTSKKNEVVKQLMENLQQVSSRPGFDYLEVKINKGLSVESLDVEYARMLDVNTVFENGYAYLHNIWKVKEDEYLLWPGSLTSPEDEGKKIQERKHRFQTIDLAWKEAISGSMDDLPVVPTEIVKRNTEFFTATGITSNKQGVLRILKSNLEDVTARSGFGYMKVSFEKGRKFGAYVWDDDIDPIFLAIPSFFDNESYSISHIIWRTGEDEYYLFAADVH